MDGREDMYREMGFKNNGGGGECDPNHLIHVQWAIVEAENDSCETESTDSIGEDSCNDPTASTSSSELEEDASSSQTTSSPSPSPQFGPLYELSDLMNQLPIKRGLSKHYQGKAESFTSLANVKSLEDLAKKIAPFSRRMKSCKSFAGLGGRKFGPKITIAKKSSRGSSFSSFTGSKGNPFIFKGINFDM